MMTRVILISVCLSFCFCFSIVNHAQANGKPAREIIPPVAKTFKVLTNGRQVTFQSKYVIKSLMMWTASGHRFVEEKNINQNNFTVNIFINEKIFFVMLEMADGKRFTEKIGIK